jgi:hypothetical protein
MRWANAEKHRDVVAMSREILFTSITPKPRQTYYLTRFKGDFLSPGKDRQGRPRMDFPFNAKTDEVYLNPRSTFGKSLIDVGFEPLYWNFYPDYAGVVEVAPPPAHW